MYLPSARISALGGPHAALTDDLSTLFNNPSGFKSVEREISVAEITAHLAGPVFDLAGLIMQASSEGAETLLSSPDFQSVMKGLYTQAELLGPIAFGYVGNGIGFGIFNNSDVTFANTSPLTITATMSEQIIMCGGYAFRIPLPEKSNSTLDIGFLLKGGIRGEVELKKSFLEIPLLFSSLNSDLITEQPFDVVSSIGFDVGLRYSFKEIFTVGLSGRDIFTPTIRSTYDTLSGFLDGDQPSGTVNGVVPLDFSAGILFSPRLGKANNILSALNIMLDYNDIFDFLTHPDSSKNPLLHIGFGIETVWLEILSVRAGFYQGLFSAGIGLDLHFCTLNTSMFGSELGSEPGMRPVYNIMVGLEFRF